MSTATVLRGEVRCARKVMLRTHSRNRPNAPLQGANKADTAAQAADCGERRA
jgi:hypothetical protein